MGCSWTLKRPTTRSPMLFYGSASEDQALYHNTEISVRAGGGRSESFALKRGLHQGCLLSPEITSGWEWAHLMMGCLYPAVAKARWWMLRDVSGRIHKELKDGKVEIPEMFKGVDRPASIGGTNGAAHAVAVTLVGGVVGEYGGSYTMGYGHIDVLPARAKTHTYINTSHFLDVMVPYYLRGLQMDDTGERVSGPDDVRLQDICWD
ncbi:hypothetical protein BC628DRAFT_1472084 [Trametes gibbosa]|nr:hypothetical protein BC628DRAFT_1472084 [Trametes gibbosa]